MVSKSNTEEPTQLDLVEHIKRLEDKIEALMPKAKEPVKEIDYKEKWPKRHTVYLHSSKEDNAEFADKYGMKGEVRNEFRFVLSEVTVELDVFEDGSYKVVSHDLLEGSIRE